MSGAPDEREDVTDSASQGDAPYASNEVPAASTAATPERPRPVRNWVTMRQGSLDSRVGVSVIEKVGKDLKSLAGRPRLAMLLSGPSAPQELVVECNRWATEAGFEVHAAPLAEGPGACTLEEACRLTAALGEAHLTSDDVALAIGDVEALSVASFACGTWEGGIALAEVPTNLHAAVAAALTPRGLDAYGVSEALVRTSAARIQYADLDVLGGQTGLGVPSEATLMARAIMVQTAVVDGEHPFAHLWDRAEAVASGSEQDVSKQLGETLKGRGRTISSASVATRQSIGYGVVVARALARVAPDAPASTCLAEALRLSSRLGVVAAGFSVDDMLAQDELLEMLGLPELECEIDPTALVAALRSECLSRSNKLMYLVPHALGRVRFSNIDEATLLEHATAWCDSRA